MNSVSNGSQPSRQPRKYGRSATTSVAQLFTENDVVRSCTNLIQRLTTKNLTNPRASEFNGNCESTNTPYISANPTTAPASMLKSSQTSGPESPAFERRGQISSRKNSGGSIASNPSDSYAFVKYKPPLPTSSSAYGSNGTLQNGSYKNGDNDSNSNNRSSRGVGKSSGGSATNLSYFGNDRLKELEQKLSDRYQRIFGSGSGGSSSSVVSSSNKNLVDESPSDLRVNMRSRKYEDMNDDFRGYGLTKSASTSSGATSSVLGSSRLPYSSSTTSSYGYGLGDGVSGGSSSRLPLSSSNLASSGIGSRGHVDFYSPRRSYGLAKSASSSVIQDSGLGLNSGGSSGKYYSLFGSFNSGRPYGGSNSQLLEPVPETQHKSSLGGGYDSRNNNKDARSLRESSGLSRSNTLNNLDRVVDEDSVDGGGRGATLVRTDSNSQCNGDDEPNGSTRSSQRKSSYKLPSRYYYRRYRHKSSHAPPKEASPLRLTNDVNHDSDQMTPVASTDYDEDDKNNNTTSTAGTSSKKTSIVNNTENDYALALALSHQLNGVLPSIPSSHVLAYDITPRNKTLKDAEDFLNGVGRPEIVGGLSGGDRNRDRFEGVDEHFARENSDTSDVDVVRKKEIEDLIKKYSGFTYTSSKYVQLKTPASGNGVEAGAANGNASDQSHHQSHNNNNMGYKDDLRVNNGYNARKVLPVTGSTTGPISSGVLGSSSLAQSSSSHSLKYEYGKSSRATLGYGALEDTRNYGKSYRTGKEVSNAVIYNDIVSYTHDIFLRRVVSVCMFARNQCDDDVHGDMRTSVRTT